MPQRYEMAKTSLPKRTAKAEYELGILESLLEEPFWSARRASLVMAGLDPERFDMAQGHQRFRSVLPGLLAKYQIPEQHPIDWELVRLNLTSNLEVTTDIFTGAARSPLGWAQVAHSFAYEPAWLPFVDSAKCRQLIATLKGKGETSIQSKGGFSARNATPQYKAKQMIVAAWDASPPGDQSQLDTFRRKMINDFGKSDGAKDSSIRKWVRELWDHRETQDSLPWVEEIRRMKMP